MASLKLIAAAFALAGAQPAQAEPMPQSISRWRPFVAEASARFGVPVDWIERVMRAESGGWTILGGRPITSRKGAMGLMQLMPESWNELRGALGLGVDPYDPRDNILAGTAYLRRMYDRFGYPGLFAAYNAGPARYATHLAGGAPLPSETGAYLGIVGAAPRVSSQPAREHPQNGLFFALGDGPLDGRRLPEQPPHDRLFVVRSGTSPAGE